MCKRVERICQVDPEGWYAPVIGEELVRCKDCQHYEAQSGYFWGMCGVNAHDVDKTDWCCWAEKKETE